MYIYTHNICSQTGNCERGKQKSSTIYKNTGAFSPNITLFSLSLSLCFQVLKSSFLLCEMKAWTSAARGGGKCTFTFLLSSYGGRANQLSRHAADKWTYLLRRPFIFSGYTVITGRRPLLERCRVQRETGLNLIYTHVHTHTSISFHCLIVCDGCDPLTSLLKGICCPKLLCHSPEAPPPTHPRHRPALTVGVSFAMCLHLQCLSPDRFHLFLTLSAPH